MGSSETVKDGRKPGWFWMHDAIIDRFGAELGANGLAVYSVLARRANADGQCYPGQRLIAETLGISRNTVIAKIDVLEQMGLIAIDKRLSPSGDHLSSVYTLLDPPLSGGGGAVSEPPLVQPVNQGGAVSEPRGGAVSEPRVVQPSRQKEMIFKDNTLKDNTLKDSSSSSGTAEEDDGELSPELSRDCNLLSGWLACETGYSKSKINAAISAALQAGRDPYDVEDAIHGWLAHCKRRDGIKVPGALIATRILDGQLAPKEDRQRAEVERGLTGPYSVLDGDETE